MKGISFIFPCLNEEATLSFCIEELQKTMAQRKDIEYEIIVADNGSTDASAEIASAAGARVVPVRERGYGAALKGGFSASRYEYLAFADADGSYPLNLLPELYDAAIENDADMVVSSRMNGAKIEPGAMPFLHRYLGTPILTWLINLFFHGHLSDCNSGFRHMKKSSYDQWNLQSNGMEFASELLITAMKANAKIVEIKGGLRCDRRNRAPHLRTWRDGMRHLLFILSAKPEFFDCLGGAGLLLSIILTLVTLLVGPQSFGKVHIFDIHTKLFLIGSSVISIQLYLMGCYLYTISDIRPYLWLTRKFLDLDEANIFFFLLMLFVIEGAGTIMIFVIWYQSNFHNLMQSNLLFGLVQVLVLVGCFMIGLLTNSILKNYIHRIKTM